MTEKKVVLPSWEVTEIQGAVEGAATLLSEMNQGGLSTTEADSQVPRMVAAILNLSVERMRLLNRVLRGDRDAGDLMASFNSEVDSPTLREDVGVILEPGEDRVGRSVSRRLRRKKPRGWK